MMTSLDALIITFLVLTGISFAGLLIMFLGRKESVKKFAYSACHLKPYQKQTNKQTKNEL